jgi:hypothetical protein
MGRKPDLRKRGNPDPKTLRNRLLMEIIKEKLSTEGLISIDEKSKVAISFFEGLKFKHDQRVQAEQTLIKDAVECLSNYHEKEVRQYAKHLKCDNFQLFTSQACHQYWSKLTAEHYAEV